jgi:hypothetical protein
MTVKSFNEYLSEAYNLIPNSASDIDNMSHLSDSEKEKAKELFNTISTQSGHPNPFAMSSKKGENKKIKISRTVSDDFDLSALSKGTGFKLEPGEGSRGGRGTGNKGFEFEDQIVQDVELYIQEGIVADFKYKDMMRKLHTIALGKGDDIVVKKEGEANTKRPLIFGDIDAVIGGRELEIGHKITDVTVHVDGNPVYISAKTSGTVTFFNAGVRTIFPDADFESGKIRNKDGKKLLKMLGIDEDRFIETFTGYSKDTASKSRGKTQKDIVDVTRTANKKALQRLLLTGIGHGYIMAHKKGKKVETYEMTRGRMRRSSAIKSIKVLYPKKGQAKRIDIEVVTPIYIFKFNIRNKQGGLYPSHLMCDYKPNPDYKS